MENESKYPICRKCGVILTDENWYDSYKETNKRICKKCDYKYLKKWRQDNKDRYNQIAKIWQENNKGKCSQLAKKWRQGNRDRCNQLNRESNHRLVNEVIDGYGGKCACCGETRKEFLSIDHKNGNGNKHRKEMRFSGHQFYRWLKKNNYPEGYQVLCFNCNMGKRNFSVCPHNEEIFKKEFEANHKTADRKSVWKLRLNVIEGYGGKCELCGESNPHFLTIDHVDGGGSEERRVLGGWEELYRKLRDEGYPRDNYRLLCYNCNCALGFNKITEEEII